MAENIAKAVESFDGYLDYIFGEYPAGEDAWQTIRARLVELEAESERLRGDADDNREGFGELLSAFHKSEASRKKSEALLRECDEVARKRGDKYGLCDAIDNAGQPYQSQFLADCLAHLSENGHG